MGLHDGLFWFVSLTTLSSGGLGFLLKLPNFYHPETYLVYSPKGVLAPGTGETPFEQLATFVFGITYVAPIFGLAYARWFTKEASAMRAACIVPFLYHATNIYGVLVTFRHALSPEVSLSTAVGVHAFYAGLFAALAWTATNKK